MSAGDHHRFVDRVGCSKCGDPQAASVVDACGELVPHCTECGSTAVASGQREYPLSAVSREGAHTEMNKGEIEETGKDGSDDAWLKATVWTDLSDWE
jgi:hypothetical protein